VALSTARGRSAVAVLRMSGPESRSIVERVSPNGPSWRPRRAQLRSLDLGDGIAERALVTWMPGPGTVTGEDLVELGCHGNPLIVERLLDVLVENGARLARAGELTRRAVENGRIDLLEAEAVGARIEARSAAGLALLGDSLRAEIGERIDRVSALAAELEVRIDHPGEELGERSDEELLGALEVEAASAAAIADGWRAGRRRLEGARVVLVGPVNAGKSSLFNHLVGMERALVSPRPGTTRDAVERPVVLGALEVTFVDTAGEGGTDDDLEARGVAIGRGMADEADLLVVVLPLHEAWPAAANDLLHRTQGAHRVLVGTHADVGDRGHAVDHRISNASGAGIEALRAAIARRLEEPGSRALLFSSRQFDLYSAVASHLRAAAQALGGVLGPAVAAEEATRGLERLTELSGQDARESVLDAMFARFCIGK
jgi:tRNA modification GTPase